MGFKQFTAGSKSFISKDQNVHFSKNDSWFDVKLKSKISFDFDIFQFSFFFSLIFQFVWIFVGAEINLFRNNTVIHFPHFMLQINCFIF